MSDVFPQYQTIKFNITFERAGVDTSVTGVELLLTNPNGVVESITPTETATGVYSASYAPTVLGRWTWRLKSTPATGAEKGTFDVE